MQEHIAKYCPKCEQVKPENEFYRIKSGRSAGKLQGYCCECSKRSVKKHIQTAAVKPWQSDKSREYRREWARKWRAEHPEESRARSVANERKRSLRADVQEKKRAWKVSNQDKSRSYQRRCLCKKHGVSVDWYIQMLEAQGGVCAICKKPERYKSRNLSIDHDHRCCPGNYGCAKCVRGLICQLCNHGLGCFFDSAELLLGAAEYLTDRVLKVVARMEDLPPVS